MFCQKSARKLRQLTSLQSSVVIKSNIYNDSIKKPKKLSKTVQPPEKMEDSYTVANLLFGPNRRFKKDWFEDFRRIEHSHIALNNWFVNKKKEAEMHSQIYIEERHQILGSDLAAGYFILCRGGKVKFRGMDWMTKEEDRNLLPNKFNANYLLEKIDCSGMNLIYEGLHNLKGLNRLRWISFRGNKMFNDWCMDKISGEFLNLEYLDVSECELVTERGLECLYKIPNLKKVVITNYNKTDILELVFLMLAECNSSLEWEILPHPEEHKKKDE